MATGGEPTTRARHPVRLVVATLALLGLLLPQGAGASFGGGIEPEPTGSPFEATVDGTTVTVDLTSTPDFQARVEAADDTILATGLVDGGGRTTMSFDLPAGEHEIEVIVFDTAGIPQSLGARVVTVAGPPPPPPGVTVQTPTPEDGRTILRITGPPGASFRADIAREGERVTEDSGELDGEGNGAAVFVLENGPWGYLVTVRTPSGTSEATLGEFENAVGPPAKPKLSLVPEVGTSRVTIAIEGPAGGTVTVTAKREDGGEEVSESTDIGRDRTGEVELRLPDEGAWKITAVATDIQDQTSEVATLEGGVTVRSSGPELDVKPISAGDGEFGFKIVTEKGAKVRIDSETEELREEFTAEDEETERKVEVPEGVHVIEVHALDEFGNETVDVLSSDEEPGGGFPTVFVLLVLGILAAFGIFAFVKRQELQDWWYSRQYH